MLEVRVSTKPSTMAIWDHGHDRPTIARGSSKELVRYAYHSPQKLFKIVFKATETMSYKTKIVIKQ